MINVSQRIKALCGAALLYLSAIWVAPAGAAEAGNFAHTIYLVRHGSYVPDPKAAPEPGPGLTALGIAQARLVGARLASLPVPFAAITSSTLTRAQQTAAEIRAALPRVPGSASPMLSECTPPPSAPAANAAIAAAQSACKERLDVAFAKFISPPAGADRTDVLVCHGNVIRYFVSRALGLDARLFTSFVLAHASLTVVRVRTDGSMVVLAVGDVGHIPPNLQSYGGDDDPQLVAPGLGVFATK